MTQQTVAAFLLLVPFIIQPVLLGVYAKRRRHRNGALWALLGLPINIAIFAFFTIHRDGKLIADAFVEMSIIITISTTIILSILALLRNSAEHFPARLRRGLFRIWVLLAVVWTTFCMVELDRNIFFFSDGYIKPDYFHIGIWLIGTPALVFAMGLAACWVVDGFRRERREVVSDQEYLEAPSGAQSKLSSNC